LAAAAGCCCGCSCSTLYTPHDVKGTVKKGKYIWKKNSVFVVECCCFPSSRLTKSQNRPSPFPSFSLSLLFIYFSSLLHTKLIKHEAFLSFLFPPPFARLSAPTQMSG
jgi:hypothetical protein